MKIHYKDWSPTQKSQDLVDAANAIIAEYSIKGFTLTLRQLYYQFVARDIIPNTERSYKNLGTLITKARLAGMVSWEAIEDRNREHNTFWTREDEYGLIANLPNYIRFDQWERQSYYVEVWVEKEALGNVIAKACEPWLVPHMSCKGYLSASEAWRAGQRFEDKIAEGKDCVLIHLGDHDPSGIDMTRDNADRLQLLSRAGPGEIEVRRIALNRDQIDQYDPPPNPTKLTDSRAQDYIAEHGHSSWELDALDLDVMTDLITDEIRSCIDHSIWEDVEAEESDVSNALGGLHEHWDTIKDKLAAGEFDNG